MGTTPVYQIPYAELNDPPNGPNQQRGLAEAVEGELVRIDDDISRRNFRNLGGRIVTTVGVINPDIVGETDIPKLALENTAVTAGRIYTFTVKLSVQFSQANDSFVVRVRKDAALTGTVIADDEWIAQVNNFTHSKTFQLPWQATTTDTDADFYMSLARISGTGNCDVNGNRRTAIWIDEILDGSGWQEVP